MSSLVFFFNIVDDISTYEYSHQNLSIDHHSSPVTDGKVSYEETNGFPCNSRHKNKKHQKKTVQKLRFHSIDYI